MTKAMSARSIGERAANRSPALPPYAATNSASCQLRIGVVDITPAVRSTLSSRCLVTNSVWIDSSCSGSRAAV